MADEISSIYISAVLDLKKIDDQLRKLNSKKYTIAVDVNDSELISLNQHLNLKQQHLKETINFYRNNKIKVYTDQSELTRLNQQLKEIANLKIRLDFDNREILETVKQVKKEVQSTKLQLTLDTGNISKQIQNSFSEAFKSSQFKTQLTLRDERKNDGVVNALRSVEKAVNKTKPGVLGNITTGIFESVGRGLATDINKTLKSLGINFSGQTRNITKSVVSPIKSVTTDNAGFQEYLKNKEQEINKNIRQVLYKVGDAAADAIDSEASNSNEIFTNFRKNLIKNLGIDQLGKAVKSIPDELDLNDVFSQKSTFFNTSEFKKVQKGFRSTTEEFFKALFNPAMMADLTKPFDNIVRNYREYAIKERALPLVEQRAKDILEGKQTPGQKANFIKKVNSQTEQVFLTIGGYAGLEGKSGVVIARDLQQQKLPNTLVNNITGLDTDFSKSNLNNFGLRNAMMMSMAKVNLRGYNKDAVEMAAQGLAALQLNPNLKIKALGESGGGFAADETNYILNKLGYGEQSRYLGVGTPDLLGSLNPNTPNKILSPDEHLGRDVRKMYYPYGLARVNTPQQNILGVYGHTYDFYRDANVPEYNRFVYGKRKDLTPERLKTLKEYGQKISSEKRSDFFDEGEMNLFAQSIVKDLNEIREYILDATGETKNQLEELAKIYEKVVLAFSDEPQSLTNIRLVVEQAKTTISTLTNSLDPKNFGKILETKKQLIDAEKQLKTLYKNSIGTDKAKSDNLLSEIKTLTNQVNTPGILTPKTIPNIPITQNITKSLPIDFIDNQVKQAQQIAKSFNQSFGGDENFLGFKKLLEQSKKSNDFTQSLDFAQNIRKQAQAAKLEITQLRKALGSEELTAKTSMGKGAYESINQSIGQVSNVVKKIEKEFKKLGITLPDIAQDVLEGFNNGLKNSDVEETVKETFENVIEIAKDVFDIQSPSKVFQKIAEDILAGFNNGFKNSFSKLDVENLFSSLVDNVKNIAGGLSKFGVGLFVLTQVLPKFKELVVESIQIATNFELIEKNIKNLSSGTGINAIADVTKQAKDLKINIQESLEGASRLYGATVGTQLQGEPTTEIFKNFQQLFASRGLTQEQQQRANQAIAQMASKGIQSEEVRQQLAEAVPGTFQILARSQGLNTQQLDRKMRRGALPVEDLIKFSQQAAAESAINIPSTLNTTQASINRLDNSILMLKKNIGDAFLPLEKIRLNVFSSLIELLTNSGGLIKNILGYFTAWVTSPLWKQLIVSLATTRIDFAAITLYVKSITFDGMVSGMQSFAVATANALKPATLLLSKFMAFSTVIEIVAKVANKFRDLSGEIGDVSRQAENNVKYLQKIYNNPNQNYLKALDLPKNFDEIVEREKQKRDKDYFGSVFSELPVISGFMGKESFNDYLQRTQQIKKNIDNILKVSGETTNILNNPQINQNIQKLNNIDNQISDLQARKNAFIIQNPGDNLGFQNLEKENVSLNNIRFNTVKNLSEIQKGVNLRIEELKKAKLEFENILKNEPDAITIDEFNRYQKITKELEKQELAQERINKAVGKTQNAFDSLKNSVENVSARYQDIIQNIDLTGINNRTAILNQSANNQLTPGNTQFLLNQNQINIDNEKLQQSLINLKRLETLLSSDVANSVLSANNLNFTSGLNQINLISQRLAEDPNAAKDKTIVDQLAQYAQLRNDLQNQANQLAESRNTLNQQLKEATKQVREYYLSVAREVEKVGIEFKITANNINKISAQNRIREALIGAGENIYTQFADFLVKTIEELTEIENLKLNNNQIIQNGRNQVQDIQRQNRELQNSIPGGSNNIKNSFSNNGKLPPLPANIREATPLSTNIREATPLIPDKNQNSNFSSPLKNATIQQILNYQPSKGQGFFGLRDGGKRRHSKVDFDSRVGGGQDAIVQAFNAGVATWYPLTSNSGGIHIKSDFNGSELTSVYNHLNLNDLKKLFGNNRSLRVQSGQQLGRVTNDSLSTGAHLDFGIKINGQYTDPQKFIRRNIANTRNNSVNLPPGQLQNQISVGTQEQTNIVEQRTLLELQSNNQEIEKRGLQLQRDYELAVRNLRRQVTDNKNQSEISRREVTDLRYGVNPIKTPFQEYYNELANIDNQFNDAINKRQKDLIEVREKIIAGERNLNNTGIIGEARELTKTLLNQDRKFKTQLEAEIHELEQLRGAKKDQASETFNFKEVFRKAQLVNKAVNDVLDVSLEATNIALAKNPLDYSKGSPLDFQFQKNSQANYFEFLSRKNDIYNTNGLTEGERITEGQENLVNYIKRSRNLENRFLVDRALEDINKKQNENSFLTEYESLASSGRIGLLQAEADKINSRGGNPFEANAKNREASRLQENIRYAKELRDIQIQISQFTLKGIDTTDLEKVRGELQKIHELNLDKINTDFKSFKTTVESIAKDGLVTLSQSLTDLILKGGSLTDIFDNLFNTILGGIINAGLNSLFMGLFYKGGVIPNYATGGIHGINEAMNREKLMSGKQPMLAVVHAGELQIPAERVKELANMGLPPNVLLGNFAEGGIIGNNKILNNNLGYSGNNEDENFKTIHIESTVINNVEYVTMDQFKEGLRKAAELGAEGGEKRVQAKLSNSVSFRKSVGL